MLESPSRRGLLQGGAALALAAAPLAGCGRNATAQTDTVRIGYQKDGVLVIAKQQKRSLEPRLAADGIQKIEWAQFPSGPPLLEALAAGGIDFGATGDTPPIFAQASGTDLVYVAAVPTRGRSSAILLPAASKISRIADLKGGRIAFTRGSSAHYFAVATLRSAGALPVRRDAGLSRAVRRPRSLRARQPRCLVHLGSLLRRRRAQRRRARPVERRAFRAQRLVLSWHRAPLPRAMAVSSAPSSTSCAASDNGSPPIATPRARWFRKPSGLDLPLVQTTFARADFGIVPLDAGVVARQQAIADDFARLGIIPQPVKIADAVAQLDWK